MEGIIVLSFGFFVFQNLPQHDTMKTATGQRPGFPFIHATLTSFQAQLT